MNSEDGHQVLKSVYIFSTGFYLQTGARREHTAVTRLFYLRRMREGRRSGQTLSLKVDTEDPGELRPSKF